jgi:3-phenylpropionate/trans-cinnamate dioxygenase ferredoxin subunit
VARSWHDVCSLDELAARGRVLARLGGREIGVVLDGAGRPHALRNRCPHHGAPLCLGRVRLREQGTPGSYAPAAQEVLRCPWHGWEFELESGRCPEDPAMRVAVYAVRVDDGRVLVEA